MIGSCQFDGCENLNCHLFPVHQNHLTFWNDSRGRGYLVSSVLSYSWPILWGRIKYIRGQLLEASWKVTREQMIWDYRLTFRTNFGSPVCVVHTNRENQTAGHGNCSETLYMKCQSNLGPHYFLIDQLIIPKFYLLSVCFNNFFLKAHFFFQSKNSKPHVAVLFEVVLWKCW
jgi:hypothetical protein